MPHKYARLQVKLSLCAGSFLSVHLLTRCCHVLLFVCHPLCRALHSTGSEGSVDKLLKQIGGFMSDIAGGDRLFTAGLGIQPSCSCPKCLLAPLGFRVWAVCACACVGMAVFISREVHGQRHGWHSLV